MSTTVARLSEEDKQTVEAALPLVRLAAPDAAKIIARLVRAASASDAPAAAAAYASVHEVAAAYSVTDQTIRNWVDRGLMPATRHLGRGPRRISRSVLASAEVLARPRPPVPDFTSQEVEALLSRSPRRRTK